MAINNKNQLRDIPIGISEDSLCSSFLLLLLELFANKSKYIYKIRTLCLLFILSITICHYLSQLITCITLHFYYIYFVNKIYCVKNLIYHNFIYNILCSNDYLMISILSALFDFAYCLLLINMI